MLCYWLTRLYLHLGCAEKIPNIAQTTGIVDIFDLRSGILGSTSQSFRTSKSSWMVDPTLPREMPSCSAIDLAEILWSSRIWSIISGAVTVLGRTERGTSQVEKLPRLKWATQFLTAYNGACSPNVFFRMAWISFSALPCRKQKTWWQLASSCCEIARVASHAYFQPVTRRD